MADKETQEFYDRLSANYDIVRFRTKYHQRVDMLERGFVLDGVKDRSLVLEVGAGTGRFTAHLAEKAESIVAADVSSKMLERLSMRLQTENVELYESDIFELSELSQYANFDTVVCMRVLPHIENARKALEILAKAVKPEGNIIFDLWNRYSFVGIGRKLLGRPSKVLTKFYTYQQMQDMIEDSGLRIERNVTWGYPRVGALSCDRIGNRLFKRFGYSMVFDATRR